MRAMRYGGPTQQLISTVWCVLKPVGDWRKPVFHQFENDEPTPTFCGFCCRRGLVRHSLSGCSGSVGFVFRNDESTRRHKKTRSTHRPTFHTLPLAVGNL
mmetsp:Transcript_25584/g.37402  ORF Transcript_25584/g.37402 Transcript_25584/m.37402 type:complete len:100 (-) Transcript_25584:7-306(-)